MMMMRTVFAESESRASHPVLQLDVARIQVNDEIISLWALPPSLPSSLIHAIGSNPGIVALLRTPAEWATRPVSTSSFGPCDVLFAMHVPDLRAALFEANHRHGALRSLYELSTVPIVAFTPGTLDPLTIDEQVEAADTLCTWTALLAAMFENRNLNAA
jgi:hypothetical protein